MKKKDKIKELERLVEDLRRFIPVFKNGMLGFDFEVEHDLEVINPDDVRSEWPIKTKRKGSKKEKFTLKIEYEDRVEDWTGVIHGHGTAFKNGLRSD